MFSILADASAWKEVYENEPYMCEVLVWQANHVNGLEKKLEKTKAPTKR
jgi:hypothetical protein